MNERVRQPIGARRLRPPPHYTVTKSKARANGNYLPCAFFHSMRAYPRKPGLYYERSDGYYLPEKNDLGVFSIKMNYLILYQHVTNLL